jgi:hypothetical protein
MATFPEFAEANHEKLTKLDEDWMKSEDGKNRWRAFIESYALLHTAHTITGRL